MGVKNSRDEIQIFIEEYRKQIDTFCEKLGLDKNELAQFLELENKEINQKITTIDSNIEKKGEYTGFTEINEEDRIVFEALVGQKIIDYSNFDFSIEGVNSKEDAEKEYNKLYLERESARRILEKKKEGIVPEKISPKVQGIFDEQKTQLNELSKIDPDTAVKKFLTRKYPEIAEILRDKIDLPDLYKRIDYLPNSISENIRNIFGDEYRGFLKEVTTRGETEQQKLDEKIKEYNDTFCKKIYKRYKELSDSEKEELLEFSDGETSSQIMKGLNNDVEVAKENMKFIPIYSSYFDYREKKELVERDENRIISSKIEESIDDKLEIQIDRMSEIRGHVMPYFGKKNDLEDVNGNISKFNNLKEFLKPYLKSGDVKKSLNNMSDKTIAILREKSLDCGLDIRKVLSEISTSIESSYKEDLDLCGDMILEISNYETDDGFTSFLQNAYDEQMREDLVSVAKYRIDDQKESDKKVIRYAAQEQDEYSQQELNEIMAFCNLKYSSMECHLKDVASLSNVKVKDSDSIGLRKIVGKMDKLAQREMIINNSMLKSCNKDLRSKIANHERLLPKKNMILELKEKMIEAKNRENEGIVYGG